MADRSNRRRLRTGDGNWIGPDELQDVLANEGYSAGGREEFLKSLLTEMAQEEARENENPEGREELQNEIRRILSEEQEKEGREAKSDDV